MKKNSVINTATTASTAMLALALNCITPHAQAQIVNGGFESGLTGWTTYGDVSTQGNAPAGNSKLFITNAGLEADEFNAAGGLIGPFNASGKAAVLAGITGGLETSSGNPIGLFDGFGLSAVEGSAASQTFSALAGDTFSFVWNFGTRETALDHAFVVIDGVLTSLNSAVNPTTPGSANDLFQTGYLSFSSTFTKSGVHTVSFGVVDLNDNAVRSSLAIDQVQISAVPEADARLLLLVGLGGLGGLALFLRRRKSH
jgi:LPXTG-motif cell wall-anchored protein